MALSAPEEQANLRTSQAYALEQATSSADEHPAEDEGGTPPHANGEGAPGDGEVGHVEEIASDPADTPETVTSVEQVGWKTPWRRSRSARAGACALTKSKR